VARDFLVGFWGLSSRLVLLVLGVGGGIERDAGPLDITSFSSPFWADACVSWLVSWTGANIVIRVRPCISWLPFSDYLPFGLPQKPAAGRREKYAPGCAIIGICTCRWSATRGGRRMRDPFAFAWTNTSTSSRKCSTRGTAPTTSFSRFARMMAISTSCGMRHRCLTVIGSLSPSASPAGADLDLAKIEKPSRYAKAQRRHLERLPTGRRACY
jgi:hypothetical protein